MSFCMYCGKQLGEGEQCNCPGALAEAAGNNAFNAQPEANQGQPMMNFGQPMIDQAQPMMDQAQPMMNQAQPMMNQAQPMMDQVQPMMDQVQPMMNQGQPMMNQGQPMMNQGQPMMNQGQPMMNQGQPMMNQMYGQNNMQFEQMKQKSKTFLDILKAPFTAGTTFINESNHVTSIGFVVLQAILVAIYACILCSSANKLLSISSFLYSADTSINYVSAFTLTLLGSLIMTAARTGALTIGTSILKGNADWKKCLCICGVRATCVSVLLAVSIIVTLMNSSYGSIVFIFSSIAGMAFSLPHVIESLGLSKDKAIYLSIVVAFVLLIVMYIVFKIGLPLYLPKDLREGFNGISSFSRFLQ
ncbi:MAG: DUF4175 domain-containing protein [Lachnospiraceae bacterium]|nr:DUF4175 domain-containing protein [Lachnospiraceae bacterium]